MEEIKNDYFYHLKNTYGENVANRYWNLLTKGYVNKQAEIRASSISQARKEIVKKNKKIKVLEWEGVEGDAKFWSKRLNISLVTFYERLKRWGICEQTFTRQGKPLEKITWQGETKTVAQWAKILKISVTSMKSRLNKFGICEKTFTKGDLRFTKYNQGARKKCI